MTGINGADTQTVDELRDNIYDRIRPQPLVYMQLEDVDEKKVILLNVMRGSKPPYSFDRNYYVRKNERAKVADQNDISLLLRTANKHLSSWEKQTAIDAVFDDLDDQQIRACIESGNKLGRSNNLPEESSEFLAYFNLSDYEAIKNGAIVLFGKKPMDFLFQCRIRINAMPKGKTGDHFADSLLIDDNLFIAFERVSEYFNKRLPMLSEFHDRNWNREDYEKYPVDALDEAVVNAMVHRDYGDASGEITINIYPEKIEIINSGEIPSEILSGHSRITGHHSVLRNPIIAHMFYLRGKMEKLGRGLALIIERFKERQLPPPQWTIKSGYTKLTLFGEHEKIELNERMKTFLESWDKAVKFISKDYEASFKITDRTARGDIKKLLLGNFITKIGDGPTTRYRINRKKLDW